MVWQATPEGDGAVMRKAVCAVLVVPIVIAAFTVALGTMLLLFFGDAVWA